MIGDFFKRIIEKEYEFRELYGLTFAFERGFVINRDRVLSSYIEPAAIIYSENGEYYLAPLKDLIDTERIVKEYASTLEGERFHFQQ